MCLGDFASSYISNKAVDVSIEPDEIKSYSVPVANIDGVKPNPNISFLKNELCGDVVPLVLFVFAKFLS